MPSLTEVNERAIHSYVSAFGLIQRACWPDERFEAAMAREQVKLSGASLVNAWLNRLEGLKDHYPSLRIFWKDRNLTFMGMCRALAEESGVGTQEATIGLTDTDPRIVWNRQGAKYRRDDRDVMQSSEVKLNILERQDVESGEVRWLRTSKAPAMQGNRAIGIIGAFDIISIDEAKALASKQ